MKKIKILDCTLRDGGYINNWKFGKKTIRAIIDKLDESKVDIIECGFLTENVNNEEYSLFSSPEEVEWVSKGKTHNSMIVAMIAIGEKEIHPDKLPECNGKSITGIRLTFHNHEIDKAINWARIIKDKGYKIFMQPVGTISYTDLELLQLVERMNELTPYAFYIVDTLGSMTKNEFLHFFYNIDANLNSNIRIGFHAHNNLQLAFSNAQELSRVQTQREVILDASIYGMGRAAGNLPTELITQYINKNIETRYDVMTILDIYDEYISLIRKEYEWGYNVPYHIAASHKCHPNYASYLMNKQTLTMKDIEKIILSIPKERGVLFDKKLIEELYLQYQNRSIDDHKAILDIKKMVQNRNILILAPGKSLKSQFKKIQDYVKQEDPFVIAVNFVDQKFGLNACFVSNHKRIEHIKEELKYENDIVLIVTSNIELEREYNYICVDYFSYINQDELVFDNVGLMLLRVLEKCGIKSVVLAGFDGFKSRYDENYYNDELNLRIEENELNEKQTRIKKQLQEMQKVMKLQYLTNSVYEEGGNV